MTEMIYGGEAVVESLKNENVRHVFGLIGSATMEVFDGLYEANSIQFIGCTTSGREPTWPTATPGRAAAPA